MKMAKALAGFAFLAAVAASAAGPAASAEPAKALFGAKAGPSRQPPEPIGSYAAGCLAGGVELPETADGWQAMRLSRNRNWGHPDMIAFISRLSDRAKAIGWPGIYVGDISQPRGGPMLTGHRSHQIGLDADIWLRPPDGRVLTRAEREEMASHVVVAGNRREVNGHWSPTHHALIRAAALDPAVARIFVNAAIKRALCEGEPQGDRGWLAKVRPWWGHDAHFHIRLHCPASATGCEAQDPIGAGDGCGEDLAWWFSDEALNPKPSAQPGTRRELQLADLPAACAAVLR